MLDLDPEREAAQPKDAATVLVVRETPSGIELFCVERHARSGFLGGAVVFPGGKVDLSDRAERWRRLSTPLGARALRFGEDEAEARAFAVAALRELLEEGAILPLDGHTLDAEHALEWRQALSDRANRSERADAFAALISERRARLATGRLEALWRWITPVAESRRYDTRFYVLPLPDGQVGLHDRHETTSSFWASPRELLARSERGEIFLAPPTSQTIAIFVPAKNVADVLAIARQQSLEPVCPWAVLEGDRMVLALPGDPLFPGAHAPPADAAAPTRFVLEGGRFVGRRVSGN
jgi:8-oxo-dGTP pyrophosphatase MutT (NUDIX family)